LWGCATHPSSAVHTAKPFFQPSSEDTIQLASLASELDTLASECAAEGVCEDRVHFARALVSLFENREAARASFEQVVNLYPSSLVAASSALWLQLLRNDNLAVPSDTPQQRILLDLTAQSVREWLARQSVGPRSQTKPGGFPKAGIVQALSKQVQEREKRIAELRAQLDALKLIDQEQQDRHRKTRAPISVLPKDEIRP
jgi:TolA-binding protein